MLLAVHVWDIKNLLQRKPWIWTLVARLYCSMNPYRNCSWKKGWSERASAAGGFASWDNVRIWESDDTWKGHACFFLSHSGWVTEERLGGYNTMKHWHVIFYIFSQQQNPDNSKCCGIQSVGFSENAHWLILDCCLPPFVFPAAPSSLLFAAFPFEWLLLHLGVPHPHNPVSPCPATRPSLYVFPSNIKELVILTEYSFFKKKQKMQSLNYVTYYIGSSLGMG